jgi:hypothetical protein
MTKKTRQRKNIKRQSRKQSSRRRVMRQRGGNKWYKPEDKGAYGMIITVNSENTAEPGRNKYPDTPYGIENFDYIYDQANKKGLINTRIRDENQSTVDYSYDNVNKIHYLIFTPLISYGV